MRGNDLSFARSRGHILCQLIQAYYDEVKGNWEDRFERLYGRWRGFLDRTGATGARTPLSLIALETKSGEGLARCGAPSNGSAVEVALVSAQDLQKAGYQVIGVLAPDPSGTRSIWRTTRRASAARPGFAIACPARPSAARPPRPTAARTAPQGSLHPPLDTARSHAAAQDVLGRVLTHLSWHRAAVFRLSWASPASCGDVWRAGLLGVDWARVEECFVVRCNRPDGTSGN